MTAVRVRITYCAECGYEDEAAELAKALMIEFREPGFAPAPLLEHLVTAGYLGRKTGKGFRDYTTA